MNQKKKGGAENCTAPRPTSRAEKPSASCFTILHMPLFLGLDRARRKQGSANAQITPSRAPMSRPVVLRCPTSTTTARARSCIVCTNGTTLAQLRCTLREAYSNLTATVTRYADENAPLSCCRHGRLNTTRLKAAARRYEYGVALFFSVGKRQVYRSLPSHLSPVLW
jgi:hypothetical protein